MTHHDPSDARAYTRREFSRGALAFASTALCVPSFLQRSAVALPKAGEGLASIAGVDEGRVLVVVQLSGGNDGLNTVAPHGLDEYRRARPRLGLTAEQCLTLEKKWPGLGLHGSMTGIKDLYDDGLCAVVQGIGYPNPNRSHFSSMDIWHTASADNSATGWLGRYFDSECPNDGGVGRNASGLAIGGETPLALMGQKTQPVNFQSPELYRWVGADGRPGIDDRVHNTVASTEHAPGSAAEFLQRTALEARVSSDLVREAAGAAPLVNFPRSGFASQLKMVASMIRKELPTRVYYTSLGGFDTHAGQGGAQGRHANLLAQFSSAIKAFYDDLRKQGNAGRVLTVAFSEFGRRVEQNASNGTDHGTAAPMFMFGPMVNAGVRGDHPSMTHLDNGDLIHTTDFRQVYATVLQDWLAADAKQVLGARYKPMNVLRV